MSNREQRLQAAVKKLAPYYGLASITDFAKYQEFLEPLGAIRPGEGNNPNIPSTYDARLPENSPEITKLVELIIDNADGCLSSITLANELTRAIEGVDSAIVKDFLRKFYLCADSANANTINSKTDIEKHTLPTPIQRMLGNVRGEIVENTSHIDKEKPTVSILMSNSKRVSPSVRFANACTIFLNGVPNIEIAKAVPYLSIEFHHPRSPLSDDGGRKLQAPGLLKFLLGAQKVSEDQNNPTNIMVSHNTIKVTRPGENDAPEENIYSIAGMEIFTAPQTLVNADEMDNPDLRANPILDKFRPFATIKDFEVNIAPSVGIFCFKTAKLSFVLHDRSRLSEIADFLRPDLYGLNEMEIEYGWSHPDGERIQNDNLYGDLINGMRIKELYGIQNASYTFDEAGQCIVTLQLFTRGASDLSTEVISTQDMNGGVSNIIREIRRLEEIVAEARQRLYVGNDNDSREVRGVQILDIAQDALSYPTFSDKIKKAINSLQRRPQSGRNGRGRNAPSYQGLITAITEIFGPDGRTGQMAQLRSAVQQGIKNKVKAMIVADHSNDPFFVHTEQRDIKGVSEQQGNRQGGEANQRARNEYNQSFGVGNDNDIKNGSVSLAMLLLHFIATPLATTKKFDEVQMVFYPFNAYAGFASKRNIAEFEVDLAYFTSELIRYRLDNIARSSNMTLRDFLSFVTSILIDDPTAQSYGLIDSQGALFNTTYGENGVIDHSAVNDAQTLNERLETLLKNKATPDGSFRMPKVDFQIECLPEKLGSEDGVDITDTSNGKSILRIHVFDAVSTPYDTIGQLLMNSRNTQIQAVCTHSETQDSSPTREDDRANATRLLQEATRRNILKPVEVPPGGVPQDPDSPVPSGHYILMGGSRKIKEFIYSAMPYIIYGSQGTLIKVANLSSIQNAELSTVNMLRTFNKSDLEPNGEMPGGLPMRIIPAEMQMSCFGCPLLSYAQQFFVDFQTGTTADNIYSCIGISHRITDGEFTTDVRMLAPTDAYGTLQTLSLKAREALDILRKVESQNPQNPLESGR